MAVYKFRVTFEDYDEISRDIEIKATQTFEDLHKAIQKAIGFETPRPASFYMSDDYWKKGTEIPSEVREGKDLTLMEKAKLSNYIIDPHQKIYYLFDYEAQWTFFIELTKILKDEGVEYPRCVRTFGDAPKQKGASNLGKASTEFDFLDVAIVDTEVDEHPEGVEGDPEDLHEGEEEIEADEFGEQEEHEEI